MAVVNLHFSATVKDGLGTKGTAVAYLAPVDSTTLATLVTDLATWLADLDAVTDGVIIGNRIELTPALPGGLGTVGGKGAAFVASRIEQTGILNLSNATTQHRSGFAIPAVIDAAIVSGKLDLTNAAIAAMIALLTGGTYTNSAAQALVALIDAVLSFRRKQRQLGRSSFE